MKLTYAAARVNAGLSQAEAAKKLGVSAGTLVNWEKYKRYPTILKFTEMANLYGVSIEDLVFLPRVSTQCGQKED